MSLFAGVGGALVKHEPLNWLTNVSFDAKEAKRLHNIQLAQEAQEKAQQPVEIISDSSSESEEEERSSKKKKKRKKKKQKAEQTTAAEAVDVKVTEDTLVEDKDWGTTKDKAKILGIEKQMFDKSDKRKSQALWDEALSTLQKKKQKKLDSGSDTDSSDSDSEREDVVFQPAPVNTSFVHDVKGDYNNVLYETLYRLDVPSYKRTQHSSCLLGLQAHWKVSRDVLKVRGPGQPFLTGQDKALFKRTLRYYSRHRVLQQRDAAMRSTVQAKTEDDPYITQSLSFVPLAGDEKKETEPAKPMSIDQVLMDKTREFNVNLRANPHSIALWFRFIEFQDEANPMRKANPAHILEKKISIFEKAMEANSENEDLMVAYLSTCAQHYPPDKLNSLWQGIIDRHMNSETLWKEYVLYHQTQYSQFSVAHVSSVYSSALRVLGDQAQKLRASKDLNALGRVEETMASVFVGFCSLCAQAGFTERATALYQAIIEFNCFRPKQFRQNPSGDLAAFEVFWESDASRIGDAGATTWQQFDPNQDIAPREEEKSPPEFVGESLKAWLQEESQRDQTEWLPFRTVAEDDNDANFERVVLFDDLKPFMCHLTTPKAMIRLVLQTFQYLGLENRVPWSWDASSNARFSVERVQELQEFERVPGLSLLFADNFGKGPPNIDLWGLDDMHCDGLEGPKLQFARNMLPLVVAAFPGNMQFKNLSLVVETKCGGIAEGRKLAKRWLKADSANLRLWNSYAQLEKSCGSMTECRNVYEKALLLCSKLPAPQQRFSPLLFWCFAQLELKNFFASLSSPPSSQQQQQPNSAAPPPSSSSRDYALHILVSVSEPNFVPFDPANPEVRPTRLVRARKAFQDLLQSSPADMWKVDEDSELQASPLALLGVCFAWMEYLSKGVAAARNVFETYVLPPDPTRKWDVRGNICGYSNGSAQHEWVLTRFVQLIQCHVNSYPSSPRLLRGVLQHALKIFPSNSLFLALFVCSESRSQVTGQLRRFFDEVTNPMKAEKRTFLSRDLAPTSPMIWIFAISWEMARARAGSSSSEEGGGGTTEVKMGKGFSPRIMRLFEKALQGSRPRSCVALWRLYMRYFLYCGNFDFAHKVYIRCIQQCPWAKRAWLDGLLWLADWLEDKQVRDLFLMMQEKEIRLRTNYSNVAKQEEKETTGENSATTTPLDTAPTATSAPAVSDATNGQEQTFTNEQHNPL